MQESSRTTEPPVPMSTIVWLVLWLVISALLIALFLLPVVPASRGFGVGPTATLAAPLPPTQ